MQVVVAIKWVRAFLNVVEGNMVRTFALDTYSVVGPFARMVFDASPWEGLEASWLWMENLVSWFATKFGEVDEKAIGIQFGNSASRRVAEALAVLVGVRAWLSIWLKGVPNLQVKSDGVAASTLVTGSPQVAPAARELVLTFSESCVRPQVVKHTSGVANKLADLLEVPIRPRTMNFLSRPVIRVASGA